MSSPALSNVSLTRHSRPWSINDRARASPASNSKKNSTKLNKNGCLPGCTNYPRCACRRKNALKEKIKSKFDLSAFLVLSKESEQLSAIRLLADLVEDGKIGLNECVEKKTLERLTYYLLIPALQHAALETLGVLLYVWLRVTKAANKKAAKNNQSAASTSNDSSNQSTALSSTSASTQSLPPPSKPKTIVLTSNSHQSHTHTHSSSTSTPSSESTGCSVCPTCRASNSNPLPSNYSLPAQSLDDWLCTPAASALISATLPLLRVTHTRHMASYVLLHFCDGAKTATTLINTPNAIETLLEVYASLADTKDNSMLLELSSIITGICIKPTKETLPKLTPIAPVLLARFRHNSNSLLTAYICKALGRLCDGQKEIAELVLAANISSYLLFLYYAAVEREKTKKKTDMEGVLFEDVFGLLGLLAFYEKPQAQKLLSPLPPNPPTELFTLDRHSLQARLAAQAQAEAGHMQEATLSDFVKPGEPKLDLVDIISIVLDLVDSTSPSSSDWYYVQCAAWQINMILTNGLAVRDSVFRRQRLIVSKVFSKMLRMIDSKASVMPAACLCSLAQALSYSVLGASSAQIGYLVMQGMLSTMLTVMHHSKTTRKLLLCVLHALHAILAMGERDRWRYTRRRVSRALNSTSTNSTTGTGEEEDDDAVFDSCPEDDFDDDSTFDDHDSHDLEPVMSSVDLAVRSFDDADDLDDDSESTYESDESCDYIVQEQEKRRKGEDEGEQRRGNKRRLKKRAEPSSSSASSTQSSHSHDSHCHSHSACAECAAASMCHGCHSCVTCSPPSAPLPSPVRPPQNGYVAVLRLLDAESQLARIESQLGGKQTKEDQALLTLMRKVNAYFKHTPNPDINNPFLKKSSSQQLELSSQAKDPVTVPPPPPPPPEPSGVQLTIILDHPSSSETSSSQKAFQRPQLSIKEQRRRREQSKASHSATQAAYVVRRRELRWLLTGMRGELPSGLAPQQSHPAPKPSITNQPKPVQSTTNSHSQSAQSRTSSSSSSGVKGQDKASVDEILRMVSERERALASQSKDSTSASSTTSTNNKSMIAALEERQRALREKKERKERELKRAQLQLAAAVEQASSTGVSTAASPESDTAEMGIVHSVTLSGESDDDLDSKPSDMSAATIDAKKEKKRKDKKAKAKQKKEKNRALKSAAATEDSEDTTLTDSTPVSTVPEIDPIETMREQRRLEQEEMDRKRQELGLYTRQQAAKELELTRERMKEEARQRELEKQRRKAQLKAEEKQRQEERERQNIIDKADRERKEKERIEKEEQDRIERARRVELEAARQLVLQKEAEAAALMSPIAICKLPGCKSVNHTIIKSDKYVVVFCSKHCRAHYHHPQCWQQARGNSSDAPMLVSELKEGSRCPLPGCTGLVHSAMLKEGENTVLSVLITPTPAVSSSQSSPAKTANRKKREKAKNRAQQSSEERKETESDQATASKKPIGFEVVVPATQKDFVPVIPKTSSFPDDVKERLSYHPSSNHSGNHIVSRSESNQQRLKGRAARRTRIDLANFTVANADDDDSTFGDSVPHSHPVQFTRTAYGGIVRTNRDGTPSHLLYMRPFPESFVGLSDEEAVNDWIVRACSSIAPVFVTRFYAPSALLVEFPSVNESLLAFHSLNRRLCIQFATHPVTIISREELPAATTYCDLHMQLARKGQAVEQLRDLTISHHVPSNLVTQSISQSPTLLPIHYSASAESSPEQRDALFPSSFDHIDLAAIQSATPSVADEEELTADQFDFSFLAIGHDDEDIDQVSNSPVDGGFTQSNVHSAAAASPLASMPQEPIWNDSQSFNGAVSWETPKLAEQRTLFTSLQSVFTPLSIVSANQSINQSPKLRSDSIVSLAPVLDSLSDPMLNSSSSRFGLPSFSMFNANGFGDPTADTSIDRTISQSINRTPFFSALRSDWMAGDDKISLLRMDDDDEVWNDEKLSSLHIKNDIEGDDESLSGILTHHRHDSIADSVSIGRTVSSSSDSQDAHDMRLNDDDSDLISLHSTQSQQFTSEPSSLSHLSASPPGFQPLHPAYSPAVRPFQLNTSGSVPPGFSSPLFYSQSIVEPVHPAHSPVRFSGQALYHQQHSTQHPSQSNVQIAHPSGFPFVGQQQQYYSHPSTNTSAQNQTTTGHPTPQRTSGQPQRQSHAQSMQRSATAMKSGHFSNPSGSFQQQASSAHAFLPAKLNEQSGSHAHPDETHHRVGRMKREFIVDLEADFPSLGPVPAHQSSSSLQSSPVHHDDHVLATSPTTSETTTDSDGNAVSITWSPTIITKLKNSSPAQPVAAIASSSITSRSNAKVEPRTEANEWTQVASSKRKKATVK